MSSREHYTVNASTIAELATALNFVFARLADRMDKIEGVRGNPTFESDLDLQSNKITDASQATDETDGVILSQIADQGLDTSDGPTFAALTVVGDLSVGDDVGIAGDLEVTGNVEITGDLTVSGNASFQISAIITDDIKVKDDTNTVIHSFEVGS